MAEGNRGDVLIIAQPLSPQSLGESILGIAEKSAIYDAGAERVKGGLAGGG